MFFNYLKLIKQYLKQILLIIVNPTLTCGTPIEASTQRFRVNRCSILQRGGEEQAAREISRTH